MVLEFTLEVRPACPDPARAGRDCTSRNTQGPLPKTDSYGLSAVHTIVSPRGEAKADQRYDEK
jgi:hypothetical protein